MDLEIIGAVALIGTALLAVFIDVIVTIVREHPTTFRESKWAKAVEDTRAWAQRDSDAKHRRRDPHYQAALAEVAAIEAAAGLTFVDDEQVVEEKEEEPNGQYGWCDDPQIVKACDQFCRERCAWSRAFDKAHAATVKYGIFAESEDIRAHTVGYLRHRMNAKGWAIPADALAFLGYDPVSDNHRVEAGEIIEFHRSMTGQRPPTCSCAPCRSAARSTTKVSTGRKARYGARF